MSVLILLCLLLPLGAAALILLAWRWEPIRGLAPALLGSGLAGAVLAGLWAFMNSAAPIAPYEAGPGAWLELLRGVLIFAYIGFGLGALLASPVVLAVAFIRSRRAQTPPQ